MAIKLPASLTPERVLQQLEREYEDAERYQRRRHPQWQDNYDLYRLQVKRNKLVQRQRVCIPLLKETVRTILSRIIDDAEIRFYSRSGDADRDIIMNQLWEYVVGKVRFLLIDAVDKKNELLYGRGHIKINLTRDGKRPLAMEVKRPYDVLIDPHSDPTDLETARYVVERNVLRTIHQLRQNPAFPQEAIRELEKRLQEGGERTRQPIGADAALGKTFSDVVELRLHYTTLEGQRYYCVVAEGVLLQAEPLEDVLGVSFFPFEGWADDLEADDYWSDGVADIVRDANKAINILYSQFLENRSLRSFGMYFFDATKPLDRKVEWTPRPFGFYPVPGNPREFLLPVDVPELSSVENDIQFITNLVERATAATAIEKGVLEDTKRTLGEVQIAVGNAMRRLNSITLYHQEARRRIAQKAYELLRHSPLETITLYQLDSDGKLNREKVERNKWEDPEGYEVEVQPREASMVERMQRLQLLQYALQVMQGNPRVQKIIQRELVELLDLSDIREEELRNLLSETEAQQSSQVEGTPPAGGALESLAPILQQPAAPPQQEQGLQQE